MQGRSGAALALSLVATMAVALPAGANRLTFEVWPDAQPDHAMFCSVALTAGWVTLVQVRGAGLPPKHPLRWRATAREREALGVALQAFVSGEITSVDALSSRLPPAPFVTVTWMTTLDDAMATGLYIQTGLALPPVLADVITALGPGQSCGVS